MKKKFRNCYCCWKFILPRDSCSNRPDFKRNSAKFRIQVKEIIVTRNNETSSQQYKKIGKLIKYIRESIIILKS